MDNLTKSNSDMPCPGFDASSSKTRLRGRACLECRRMKKRCDGGTPCKHCHIAIGGPLECEYVGPGGQSESQILEQDIARLEQRIYDLEHPEEYEANLVLLHMPYVSGSSQTPSNSQVLYEDQQAGWTSTFLQHFSLFGLLLDQDLIRQSLVAPTPGLTTVVKLWGSQLSQDSRIDPDNNPFLQKLLSELASAHPKDSMQTIQVELLLALWYMNKGCILQARYRANNAVSLALANALQSNSNPATHASSALGIPRDTKEAKVRINAFWMTLIIANVFALDGSLTPFNYQAENPAVTTPWPTTGNAQESLPRRTIMDFFHGIPGPEDVSDLAILARASILHERTVTHINLARAGSTQAVELPTATARALESRINGLKTSVLAVPGQRPVLTLTRIVLDNALIRVAGNDGVQAMEHVNGVLAALDNVDIGSIVPMILPHLTVVANVLIHLVQDPQSSVPRQSTEASLDRLVRFLESKAPLSPACGRERDRIRQALNPGI